MTDIDLVIKIPEETYNAICNENMLPSNVINVIKNGIPLPISNNGDLINREYLKDAFDNLCCHNCKTCRNFRIEGCSFYRCALIDNAPPVDAYSFEQVLELVKLNQQFAQEIENLKRPKGKWIRYRDNPHQPEHIKCSNCGQYWSVADHDKIFDICFKCGADMRGEENGNKS